MQQPDQGSSVLRSRGHPLKMLITGAKAIVGSQQPPTQPRLMASLLTLILSPVARQHVITHLHIQCLVTHCDTAPLHILQSSAYMI